MERDEALTLAELALGVGGAVAIAEGSQKVVYSARLVARPVILKIAHVSATSDPNALIRCEREVALLRSLDSPYLVKVLSDLAPLGGTEDSPDAVAWLEEELDGEDLEKMLGKPWNWDDVAVLLVQVGSGLALMHENSYVHRDLSPRNVRHTSTGWKIMDPGLAKHLNQTSITGLLQPGTPGHFSPEQATIGGRITPASDVFSLGILAYIALTGRYPVSPNRSPEEYVRNLLTGRLPSVRITRDGLTGDQAAVVDRCLERQPARRFLDCGEVVAATLALTENEVA